MRWKTFLCFKTLELFLTWIKRRIQIHTNIQPSVASLPASHLFSQRTRLRTANVKMPTSLSWLRHLTTFFYEHFITAMFDYSKFTHTDTRTRKRNHYITWCSLHTHTFARIHNRRLFSHSSLPFANPNIDVLHLHVMRRCIGRLTCCRPAQDNCTVFKT